VLVRVGAVALNPIDTYIRAGLVNMPLPKPFIPGCDLAGTVEALGPDVHRFKVGDRVWGTNQGLLGRQGTFAEYACAHEDWLYPTPRGVADTEAAAVALTGITAHLGLFRCARLQPGETVFVNGGTGGVGSMVLQMAKAVSAQVITTIGSADKAALCRSWGTDRVLNPPIPCEAAPATDRERLALIGRFQREAMQRDNPLAANLAVINSDLMMLEYGLHKSMNKSLAKLEVSTELHHQVAQAAATRQHV
jgi:NADPH:quinone reductase-like Zn-dependent oxidoreductase